MVVSSNRTPALLDHKGAVVDLQRILAGSRLSFRLGGLLLGGLLLDGLFLDGLFLAFRLAGLFLADYPGA